VEPVGENLSALILTGGLGRRMGQDKAWLKLGDLPLVEHLTRRILPLADELIFSTNKPDRFEPFLQRLPVPAQLVADQTPGIGPLAGISSGLSRASHDLVLVLAVDMPFVQVGLLSYMAKLAADFQAVVPEILDSYSGQLTAEPLHAFYRRSCLAAITAHLEAGQRRVVSFLTDVRTRWVLPEEVARFDPSFISFHNLNTPTDWEIAVRHLERG
jgi:molybdopterin-guanine dinucleotide biosynthesis protein A